MLWYILIVVAAAAAAYIFVKLGNYQDPEDYTDSSWPFPKDRP